MAFGCFASGMVSWIAHISSAAFTLKAANFIDASLRTGPRITALVNIFACFVIHQFVARSTLAIESSWCINAYVFASTVPDSTLIDATFTDRFILRIGTINFRIAHFRIWYAHAAAAVELCLWIAFSQWHCAIKLVAAIGAFGFTGAHQMAGNASAVFTLELIRAASDILTMWRLFIVTIRAVDAAITKPAFVDAGDAIVALEFGL